MGQIFPKTQGKNVKKNLQIFWQIHYPRKLKNVKKRPALLPSKIGILCLGKMYLDDDEKADTGTDVWRVSVHSSHDVDNTLAKSDDHTEHWNIRIMIENGFVVTQNSTYNLWNSVSNVLSPAMRTGSTYQDDFKDTPLYFTYLYFMILLLFFKHLFNFLSILKMRCF